MTFEEQLYTRFRGKVQGPFAPEELRLRAKRGRFSRHYEVSTDGTNWHRASQFPELFPPPPQTKIRQPPVQETCAKPESPQVPEEVPSCPRGGEPPMEAAVEKELYPVEEEAPAEQDAFADAAADETDQGWYYAHDSQQYGPVSLAKLRLLASSGQLAPEDLVWTDGMPDWVEAHRIGGVFAESEAGWQAQPQPGPEPMAASGMAVASFVLGLLGASLLPFLGSIAAVVFGHVALRQIQEGGDTLSGRGMAIAGLILGYIVIIAGTIVGIVMLCIFFLGGPPFL